VDPCNPSLCGPNSHCRVSNGQAVCACIAGFRGAPPSCRPECLISADCARDKACSNQKCIDPCLGACGFSARCTVVNHNPICNCPPSYTGDPFVRCIPQCKSPVEIKNFLAVSHSVSRMSVILCKLQRKIDHSRQQIPANPHRAVRTRCVKCSTVLRHAHVCPNSSESRPDVDRNVSVTANVPANKRALIKSAAILVQDRAAGTRNAEQSVIPRCAFALMTLPEIPSSNVILNRVSFRKYCG